MRSCGAKKTQKTAQSIKDTGPRIMVKKGRQAVPNEAEECPDSNGVDGSRRS